MYNVICIQGSDLDDKKKNKVCHRWSNCGKGLLSYAIIISLYGSNMKTIQT